MQVLPIGRAVFQYVHVIFRLRRTELDFPTFVFRPGTVNQTQQQQIRFRATSDTRQGAKGDHVWIAGLEHHVVVDGDPERYNSIATSELTYPVKRGANAINIELK